jgi:hypothetical protein
MKPKRFDVFQNLKWNVFIYSKNFGTKPKFFDVFQLFLAKPKLFDVFQLFLAKAEHYYLIQKLRNRTKTFGFSSRISKNKTELFVVSRKIWKLNKPIAFGPKILKSERERFVLIMNFVSKTNIFYFFGDVCRKTKANDLEKMLV